MSVGRRRGMSGRLRDTAGAAGLVGVRAVGESLEEKRVGAGWGAMSPFDSPVLKFTDRRGAGEDLAGWVGERP